MKRSLLFLAFVYNILIICAQDTWQYSYCGNSAAFYSATQTIDSGFIAAGFYSPQFPDIQVLLAKTNQAGKLTWAKAIGGPYDAARCLQQTIDSGYILSGTGGPGLLLIKTDTSGDTLWTRNFICNGNGDAYWVCETSDSGYIAVGNTTNGQNRDWYMVKTTAGGDTLWTRSFGSTYTDYAQSVLETFDGNYLVSGFAQYAVNQGGLCLVKLTPAGDTLWTRMYSLPEVGTCIRQTSDSGFVIMGNSPRPVFTVDVCLLRIDSSGNVLWCKSYGGSEDDREGSVSINSDGGFIISGYAESFGPGRKLYMVRTDMFGDTLFTRTYYNGGYNELTGGEQLADGNFIFSSQWNAVQMQHSYASLLKTDSTGRSQCGYWSNTTTVVTNEVVSPLYSTFVFKSTATTVSHPHLPVNNLRMDSVFCQITGLPEYSDAPDILLSPNPAENQLAISSWRPDGYLEATKTIEIFNTLGEKVITIPTPVNSTPPDSDRDQTYIDISGLPPSVYFVKITTERGSITKKLIVQ